MAGNDFVMVQLTPAGEAMANGHPLRIHSGNRAFVFQPGTPARVERSFEWQAVLSQHVTPAGDAMVELAPAAASTAAGTQLPGTGEAEAPTVHEETH